MPPIVKGPLAALLTPRNDVGGIDLYALENQLQRLLACGVSGVCINGATGEYPIATLEERKRLVDTACRIVEGRGYVLCGVGAAEFSEVVALGKTATEMGVTAVLLPPPHFFPYASSDLEAFYRQASHEIPAPVLIYNLPSFTTPVDSELALRLMESVPTIAGIKDSSGSLKILEALTQREGLRACRIVGNDSVLCEALEKGLCDGVISGVAGVLPELTIALFQSHREGDHARFAKLTAHLHALGEELDHFPTPWGLKLVASCRGFFRASFPLPLADARKHQMELFESWFKDWWKSLEGDLALA